MKALGNATIATVMLGIVSCTQAQRQADRSEQLPKPYTIQRDVLGEFLESFIRNNPSCKPKAGAIANSQMCAVTNETLTTETTYAGMPVMGRVAFFYQDHLYLLILQAPTKVCRQFDLLSSLKQKFGEPKNTEMVDGKEITPYGDFKIWQNGVSTIAFQESIGKLDLCSTEFSLDAVLSEEQRLEEEKKAKEKAARKTDM